MGVIEYLSEAFLEFYQGFKSLMPENLQMIPSLFLITIILSLSVIFIWSFYKFLAKRDVLKINLKKYNVYQNAAIVKLIAVCFYIIEFIIVASVAIFFWFAVFSVFILLLAKELDIANIFLISAGVVSAVRITSYYNEGLSEELAKLLPFVLLGTAIVTPGFFDVETTLARIIEIPSFLSNIFYYFMFIFGLETMLRIIYLPFAIMNPDEEEEEDDSKD